MLGMSCINAAEEPKSPNVPLPALLGLDQRTLDRNKQNKYFFSSPLLHQRMAILKNMVDGGSRLVVVWGERGSGKTTLMNQFVAKAVQDWQPCRIRLKPAETAAEETWRNLHNRMVFISNKGDQPSVIVDDAHQFSNAELKLLLQTAFPETGVRKLKSVVLFAEPQIRERFSEIARFLPPMAVIDKFSMAPLTEKQTAAYLQHRIKTAGFLRKIPFSNEQIRKIHRTSGGLPGWINGEAYIAMRRLFGGHRFNQLHFHPLRQLLQHWYHRFTFPLTLSYKRSPG
jgi:type II secretory pathway predicted ATPase ExeA